MDGFFVLLKTIPESRFPEDLIRGQKYKIATFDPGYRPLPPLNEKAGCQTRELND